jgi:hypothetical protein
LPPLLVRRPRLGALHARFGPAVIAHRRLDAVKIEMNWFSLMAKNDVVAVALIVTLAVLGILFASLFLADKLGRRSRQKRGNDL